MPSSNGKEQFSCFNTLKAKPELYESTHWNNGRTLVNATERVHLRPGILSAEQFKQAGLL